MTRAMEHRGTEPNRTENTARTPCTQAGEALASASSQLLAAALLGLLGLAACDADDADEAKITLSRVDASVTEESFREACEELNGKIEVHPGCGGKNSCRGISYDIDTHVYTEHTCQGLNTCRGFSCVLPESA